MPPLCGMTVLPTTPTLLNTFSSLLLALLCRFIPTLPHSHSPRCISLGTLRWPTLAWRRRRSKLLLFWQLVHGLGPPCLQDKLSSASSRCKYSLRNPKSMEVPLCSTSAHLSSFLPSCSFLWNTLPACHILLFTVFICPFS